MPRDWDLFSLAAPTLLIYGLLLLARVQDEPHIARRVSGPVLALVLLNAPVFIVNNDKDLLTHRLETIGVRAFKTYRYGAEYILNVAIRMAEDKPDEQLERRLRLVDKIRPYKLPGEDVLFADLTFRLAELYVERSDFQRAKRYFLESYDAKPEDALIEFCLAQAHYNLGEYDESLRYSAPMADYLTDEPDIQEVAFLAAYAGGKLEDAAVYGARLLSLRPDDDEIRAMVDSVVVALDRKK
jgi:tetratricopeptide (TPR) repeat protein